jgi:hypothetical protein
MFSLKAKPITDLNDGKVELPQQHGEAGGQGCKDSVELQQVRV